MSADLENGFAHEPEGVAVTIAAACATGLAGCSVEDYGQRAPDDIYDIGLARERVAAAAAASGGMVLTARAENFIRNRPDLADTISRLQAYQEAGADVLYAPGLQRLQDIREVVKSVDRPVNVLVVREAPTVAELAEVGVARISVGSSFATAAWGAVVRAATELRQSGTYGFLELAGEGARAVRKAFH